MKTSLARIPQCEPNRAPEAIDAGTEGGVGRGQQEEAPVTIDLKPEQQRVIDLAAGSGASKLR
jgi:hypothetical protein